MSRCILFAMAIALLFVLALGAQSAQAMGSRSDSGNAATSGGKNATSGSASATNGARPATGMPPSPVRAQPVIQKDFPIYFYGLGTAAAANTVTVRSRVDGQLMRLAFTEGQHVNQGDLLVEIDSRPYLAQLAQYEGQMMRDQALLRNAKQDLARYKVLLPQDSASPQQVDAQDSLVRQYEGVVKVDQAMIDSVRLNLTYCRITAPISGRLGLRMVDEGNMVRASDSAGLVVITQVRPITVLFTVTEAQLPRVLAAVKSGKNPPVEAWDRTRSRRLAEGQLVTIDNLIDTSTGTVKLKARFANEDDALFPNQFVNARILAETIQGAVLAPTPAVQRGNDGSFVYAVSKEGVVRMLPVATGEANDEHTVIRRGAQPGDLLVIDGLDRLRDGSTVIVAPDTQPGQTAPPVPPVPEEAAKPGQAGSGRGQSANGTAQPRAR